MNERPSSDHRRRSAVADLCRLASAVFVALVGLLGFGVGAAHAQNELVNSSPANGAQLDEAPDEIVIGFADELGDANSIALSCEGDTVDLPAPEVLDDGTTMSVPIEGPLPSGTCTARYSISSATGEPDTPGVITFVVRNAPTGSVAATGTAAGDTTGAAQGAPAPSGSDTTGSIPGADDSAGVTPSASSDPDVVDLSIAGDGDAALGLARLISTLGIATLFGALLVVTAAWPEGVEYLVTVRFLRVAWIVAVIGTLLFTVFAADAVTPDGGGSGFSPGTWFDLFDAGWAGRAALARILLVLASAWVAFRPDRAIDPTTQLAALGIPALAAAVLGLSRTVGDLPALGVLMGVLHALAMSVWVGGVILLARVVLSGPGEEDLIHAVRGFSRVSTPAIAVTIVTGVVQMIRLDGGALFQSGHGRVVVLKAVVVAVMIFVAISARQFVAQRLNRAQQMTVPLADRLRRAFGIEAGIGVLTLVLSAWLLAFTPPNVSATPSVDYAVRQTHEVEAADLEVEVSLTDDTTGPVGLQVEVRSPPEGLSDLAVILTAPPNSLNLLGYRQPVPLTGEGVAVREKRIGLPISVAGEWTIQVEATTAEAGTVSSQPQPYTVTADDSDDGSDEAPDTGGSTPPSVAIVTIAPEAPATAPGS